MGGVTRVHASIVAGILIVGASQFWELHKSDVMSARFWLGMVFAALYPVGMYLVGLYQEKPQSSPPKGA